MTPVRSEALAKGEAGPAKWITLAVATPAIGSSSNTEDTNSTHPIKRTYVAGRARTTACSHGKTTRMSRSPPIHRPGSSTRAHSKCDPMHFSQPVA